MSVRQSCRHLKQIVCLIAARLGGKPKFYAVALALTAVAFALKPGGFLGGTVNAQLAVTTVTAVAIIGYVYFTYRLAHDRGYVTLKSRPSITGNDLHLNPLVINESDQQLRLCVSVQVKVDERFIELPDGVVTGSKMIRLEPDGRNWERGRKLAIHEYYEQQTNDVFQRSDHDYMWVLLRADWVNEFCEPNTTFHCQRIRLDNKNTDSVDQLDVIEDHFGALKSWSEAFPIRAAQPHP